MLTGAMIDHIRGCIGALGDAEQCRAMVGVDLTGVLLARIEAFQALSDPNTTEPFFADAAAMVKEKIVTFRQLAALEHAELAEFGGHRGENHRESDTFPGVPHPREELNPGLAA